MFILSINIHKCLYFNMKYYWNFSLMSHAIMSQLKGLYHHCETMSEETQLRWWIKFNVSFFIINYNEL